MALSVGSATSVSTGPAAAGNRRVGGGAAARQADRRLAVGEAARCSSTSRSMPPACRAARVSGRTVPSAAQARSVRGSTSEGVGEDACPGASRRQPPAVHSRSASRTGTSSPVRRRPGPGPSPGGCRAGCAGRRRTARRRRGSRRRRPRRAGPRPDGRRRRPSAGRGTSVASSVPCPAPCDAVHGVRPGGHVLELLDQCRVDGQGRPEPTARSASRPESCCRVAVR